MLVERWLGEALPLAIRDGYLASASLKPYRGSANRWLRFLGGIQRPTPKHVLGWIVSLKEESLTVSTVATYLSAIKSLYRWAELEGHYPNIARQVKTPKVAKDTPLPCPTGDQIREMFFSIPSTNLRGLRDRGLVGVLYSTALRSISICRARVQDLDLALGTIKHQPKGHREKDAVAVLSATAREALREYFAARGPVRADSPIFTAVGNHRNDQAGLSSRSIRGIILALAESQGLVHRTPEGKVRDRGHYSVHSIRRAAITTIAERFGLDTARNLAGHASVDTTRRAYARVNSYRQHQLAAEALDF